MLSNDILHRVNRPARYTGGEWNGIIKDWEKIPVKIALAYPDVYEIGMSNIALPILYDIINRRPDALAERVFAPWVDMEAQMRTCGIPLFSLESQRPLKDFDIIGFSLGYELTYTNLLNMLDLAQLPVLSSERGDAHPLVIAGGSGALNPEPMADFIDAFILGDGEEIVPELLNAFLEWQGKGVGKKERLKALAALPGVYVPSLYRVEYRDDGLFKSISPVMPEASLPVRKRTVARLPAPPTRPVVPYIEVVHDRAAIEIQRGCSRGCRFCQAGMIYRPVRERPHDEVIRATGELITGCGYDEVSLVSLNTSDYAGIDKLVAGIGQRYPGLAISLPSLRLDDFSIRLVESLPTRSRTGLTFAPEAGSERLRCVINKNLTDESLLKTAAAAFARGWTGLKLYFMVGLPTETPDDVRGIVTLVEKVRAEGKKAGGRRPTIRVSISTFVPKPHTPFQWAAQLEGQVLQERLDIARQGLNTKGIKLSWHDPRVSLLEAALSRGDRRTGKAIHRAWELGCRFDAWTEQYQHEKWLQAFSDAGLAMESYACRERSLDEPLPWSHVDTGVSSDFLKQELQRALKEEDTPDCRNNPCNACGLESTEACRKRR